MQATLCGVWAALQWPAADVRVVTMGSPAVGNLEFARASCSSSFLPLDLFASVQDYLMELTAGSLLSSREAAWLQPRLRSCVLC